MVCLHCSPMENAIRKILRAHGLEEPFDHAEIAHVKLINPPYMPLNIEKLPGVEGPEVSVMHFFIQNGDLMRDPEMLFTYVGFRPIYYRLDSLGVIREARSYDNGKVLINTREMRDQDSFARVWAKNLIEQGFEKAKVETRKFE